MADILRQPIAWRREWDGDESDERLWLYTEDEKETRDGHTWQPLYLDPPSEQQIRDGLELLKRIRDECAHGLQPLDQLRAVRGLIEQLCSAAVAYGEDQEGEQAYYAAKAQLIDAVEAALGMQGGAHV